jgi:hypothetical protein
MCGAAALSWALAVPAGSEWDARLDATIVAGMDRAEREAARSVSGMVTTAAS